MTQSAQLFEKAQASIPGGVNSPVRAFNSVGGDPIYMKKGDGAYMWDADDNKYIDFCSSWGPLILGHCHAPTVKAVQAAAAEGLSFGTCNPREVEMAELIKELVPSIEKVRCVNSGTEATMTALRLARGYTGRNKILKFDGCYHGHADYLLVAAGSGLLTAGTSSSAGVSEQAVSEMIVVPYNDLDAVKDAFQKHGNEIAAIIVEPIAGNMGLVEPVEGFLEGLRSVTQENGSLLILDEVITGFRLGATTFGNLCGVTPDLTCLGKIIGGGMPIGALGGRQEIMDHLAPLGPVYQAGTLSGNPVALAAGVEMLKALRDDNPYPQMAAFAEKIEKAINDKAAETGAAYFCHRKGGLFTLFFTDQKEVNNLDDVKKCDTEMFASYFKHMVGNGIYISPSQFELGFVSAAHSEQDIDTFIQTALEFLNEI